MPEEESKRSNHALVQTHWTREPRTFLAFVVEVLASKVGGPVEAGGSAGGGPLEAGSEDALAFCSVDGPSLAAQLATCHCSSRTATDAI